MWKVVVVEINQVIMKEIQKNNNMITTAQVVELGFPEPYYPNM